MHCVEIGNPNLPFPEDGGEQPIPAPMEPTPTPTEPTPTPTEPTPTPTIIVPTPAPTEVPGVDSGEFVVNRKKGNGLGLIHKNGECPATGSGKTAMKERAYFSTYEEAEAFSIQIAPERNKRKCSNCWKDAE